MADQNKKEQQLKGQFEQLKREAGGIFDDLPESFAKLSEKFQGDFQKMAEYVRKTRKELDGLKTDFGGISKIFKDTVAEYRRGNDALRDSVKATNKLKDLADKLKYDQLEITELGEKDLKRLTEQIRKQQQELELAILSGQLRGKDLQTAISNLEYSQLMLEGAEKRLALETHITKQMGLGGAAIKGLSKIFDKLGISGVLSIDEISKKMREAAKEGKSKWQVLGAGMKEAFKSVGEALRDPLVILTSIYKLMEGIVKSALSYQSKMFEVSKTLGIGVTESTKLFNNFKQIAWQNSQLAMTGKQLVDSYSKINDQLGVMGPRNADFLTFATGIERRLGLGAADMENMYLYAGSTGKSVKETYANIVATTKMQGMRLKIQMSEKQIMQAISKVSATVFNNFKGNVQQIALAVQKATKFGTTLNDINQAGMQMLDFESSIAKEFEAQLLTGKNIDLSMARQYALTGNTEQLMGEITRQLGSQAEWNRMNVLQQQSLAEAMGMNKEAVDEMFRKQQLVSVLNKDANSDALTQYNILVAQGKSRAEIFQLLGQQAASDAMAASVQDKMAATMERVKDAIGEISAKIIPFVDKMANFLSNADNLKGIFSAIVALSGVLLTRSIMLTAEKKQQVATQLQLQKMTLEEQIMMNRTTILQMRKNGLISQGTARRLYDNQVARTGAITDAMGAGSKIAGMMAYLGPLAVGIGLAAVSSLLMGLPGGSGGAGAGAASSISPPSTDINPMNTAASGAKTQQSGDTRVQAAANERPLVVNVRTQVVDTPLNMSGRVERGVNIDQTKYN